MSQDSRESVFHSLRARIWLAVVVLAILNAGIGSLVFITATFLADSPYISFAAALVGMTAISSFFGYWLSKDVLRPIEAVTFFAKSLERSPAASQPRTTGSVETDQILESLQRNSRQIISLISMMDDVASGKTEKALAPIHNADRLTTSFQRLVGKVTDSVDAKSKLESTRSAIDKLRSDLAGVRHGSIDIEVRTDQLSTREVAESVALLLDRLRQVVRHVRATADSSRGLTSQAEHATRIALQAIRNGDADLQFSRTALDGCRDSVSDIAAHISTAFETITTVSGVYEERFADSIEKNAALRETRGKITQSVSAAQKLGSTLASLDRITRGAGELARRSKVVAANLALPQLPNENNPLSTKEIEHIAERSEQLGTELSAIAASVSRDLKALETNLRVLDTEVFNAVSDTEEFPTRKLTEQSNDLRSYLLELTRETLALIDEASAKLSSSPLEGTAKSVQEGEEAIHRLSGLVEELDRSTNDLSSAEARSSLTPVPPTAPTAPVSAVLPRSKPVVNGANMEPTPAQK